MKFNLLKPCPNCPFRADKPRQRGWLGFQRVRQITNAILRENKTFQCHKTLDDKHQGCMCAGALKLIKQASHKESPFGNSMVQIAERLSLYEPENLDTKVPVFKSALAMAKFHSNSSDKYYGFRRRK